MPPLTPREILAKGLRWGAFSGLAITIYGVVTGSHHLFTGSFYWDPPLEGLSYAQLKEEYGKAVASIAHWSEAEKVAIFKNFK